MGLQQLFASVVEEPVPDEFLALLDQIDANERAKNERVKASMAGMPSMNGKRRQDEAPE